jgi:hypothetical protein
MPQGEGAIMTRRLAPAPVRWGDYTRLTIWWTTALLVRQRVLQGYHNTEWTLHVGSFKFLSRFGRADG